MTATPTKTPAHSPAKAGAPHENPHESPLGASQRISTWARKDLTGLRGVPAGQIRALLAEARAVETALAADPLAFSHEMRGLAIANLFFENSTRTRMSFSLAAKRLGADVVDLDEQRSSLSKGETLTDTARVVEAMGASALVVRCAQAGAPHAIAQRVACPVVSAGDGRHEHPTQALLDAYTIAKAHGRQETFDLAGLRVLYVGDIANSRVARSGVACMTALGASVTCAGPPAFVPPLIATLGCEIANDLDSALPQIDAVIALRVQRERHDGRAAVNVRDYQANFCLTPARTDQMKEGAIVMHPGPMNRGLEIDSAVADGPRSRIFEQPRAGLYVRVAVIRACMRAVGGRQGAQRGE